MTITPLNETIRYAITLSSLGQVLVASSDKGVCAIMLHDDSAYLVADLRRRFPQATLKEAVQDIGKLSQQVVAQIESPCADFHLPLDARGTDFQQSVWRALCEVPLGTTVSYANIAERIGNRGAVRAVAQACGANHISIAIPCHRIVRADGALSGYHWGVERKRTLLGREAKAAGNISPDLSR